jgi:hypothetical protein
LDVKEAAIATTKIEKIVGAISNFESFSAYLFLNEV